MDKRCAVLYSNFTTLKNPKGHFYLELNIYKNKKTNHATVEYILKIILKC